MPDKARAPALGFLQAVSALGNVAAAIISLTLLSLHASGVIQQTPWRWMFAVGVLPALLAFVVFRYLEDPRNGSTRSIPKAKSRKPVRSPNSSVTPRWRKNVIVGMILAMAGVVGLWGIGFFSFD